jgi:signal transduction histidine kinase
MLCGWKNWSRAAGACSLFLRSLAHELRNPLAPIRNAVDVITLTPSVDVRIQRCAAIIDRQFYQLDWLVNHLLDVGRVAAGKLKVELTPTAYNDVVTASIESIRPVLEAAGQQLVVSLPPKSPHVLADAARLEQVLINLLSNATKYTPRNASPKRLVAINWSSDGGDFRFG